MGQTSNRLSNKKINSVFASTKDDSATQVINGDVLIANFVAEYNLTFPLGITSKLVKVMFPGCDVAQKILMWQIENSNDD